MSQKNNQYIYVPFIDIDDFKIVEYVFNKFPDLDEFSKNKKQAVLNFLRALKSKTKLSVNLSFLWKFLNINIEAEKNQIPDEFEYRKTLRDIINIKKPFSVAECINDIENGEIDTGSLVWITTIGENTHLEYIPDNKQIPIMGSLYFPTEAVQYIGEGNQIERYCIPILFKEEFKKNVNKFFASYGQNFKYYICQSDLIGILEPVGQSFKNKFIDSNPVIERSVALKCSVSFNTIIPCNVDSIVNANDIKYCLMGTGTSNFFENQIQNEKKQKEIIETLGYYSNLSTNNRILSFDLYIEALHRAGTNRSCTKILRAIIDFAKNGDEDALIFLNKLLKGEQLNDLWGWCALLLAQELEDFSESETEALQDWIPCSNFREMVEEWEDVKALNIAVDTILRHFCNEI